MKNTALISFFALLACIGWAQSPSDYKVLPSPDAYGLGKYYDLPVDMSNGLPSISVPLSQVQVGPLVLPLSLSYHSAGLRVAEVSSNVGTGWTLRGIPMISRVVNHLPDDNKSQSSPNSINYGYLHNGVNLSQSSYQEIDFFAPTIVYNATASDVLAARDHEPDIYTCTLLSGETFRFTIDGNAQIVTIPRRNVSIDFNSSSGVINIKDENGVNYVFDQFEVTNNDPLQSFRNLITTWYPSSISTFDNAYSINLTYADNVMGYATKSTNTYSLIQVTGVSEEGIPIFCTPGSGFLSQCDTDIDCVYGYPVSISMFTSKNISSITTSDNRSRITFVNDYERHDVFESVPNQSSSKPKTFSKVQIWDQNAISEEVIFNRSYFIANNSLDMGVESFVEYASKRRLKLDGLTFRDMLTNKNKQYVFDYYAGDVPHTADPDLDYWGFFNDAGNAAQSITPGGMNIGVNSEFDYFESQSNTTNGITMSYSNPNINKNSTLAGTRSTVLKSITYPTGGKTEFTYELNQYNSKKRSFSETSPLNLDANHCDVNNCNCSSFPSNNIVSGVIQIEHFYELFKSDIAITASSNLQQYPFQPPSCITNPSFTLTVTKPNGEVLTTITANVDPSGNSNNAKLSSFLGISAEEEADFLPGSYLFTLEAFNAQVVISIDNYFMTEINSLVNGPGLRIARIDEITNDGALDSYRTYTYDAATGGTSGILFQTPKTSHFNVLITVDDNNITSNRREFTLYSDSFKPLSNFEKGIGFYTRVTETSSNGAATISEFEWEYDNFRDFTDELPVGIPLNSSLLNKANKRNELKRNDQAIVQTSILEQEENGREPIPGLRFSQRVIRNPWIDGSGGCQAWGVIYYRYPLFTSNIRLKSQTTTLDGLTTSTQLDYRADNAHLLPIASTTTHPSGTIERVETKYPADLGEQNLLTRNILHIPLETKHFVGTASSMQWVEGQKTNFTLFSGHPRPNTVQSYNWNTNQWETEVTFQNYDLRGNPTQLQKRGWASESYTWNHDLLITRTFGNFVWSYLYYPNSKLLQRYTEPNGLQTTYSYNGFRQLTGINQYNGKSVTSIGYNYRLTDGTNKVITTVTHPDGADLTSEQEFDGLGRKIFDRQVGYGHNNQDVITKYDYDALGRLWREYQPGFGNTPGVATIYTYEESPLNRVMGVVQPAPLGNISYQYGNENNLWTRTETNALGQISKTYTDTRGRMLRTIQGKSPELAQTEYLYDERNNLVKVIPHGRTIADTDYIYHYTYDGRNNILSKKFPEKALMEFRYNTRDLMTHYKDGIHPVVYTLYDPFGRPDQTGFVSSLTSTTITSGNLLTDNDYNLNPGTLGFGQAFRTRAVLLDPTGTPSGNFIQTEIKTWDAYHRPLMSEGNHPLALSTYTALRRQMTYNDLDQEKTTTTTVQVGTNTWELINSYLYDFSGRPTTETLTFNGTQREVSRIVEYDVRDNVKTQVLGGNLQTLNYGYYSNGFLQNINSLVSGGIAATSIAVPSINTNADLFAMSLTYDLAGNIRTWQSQNRGFSSETSTYTYDGLNRLRSNATSTGLQQQSYTYRDLLGNIGTLVRHDLLPNPSGWTNTLIDNLTYSYANTKSSRLVAIADASDHAAGFKPTTANYIYDGNGNVTFDPQQQLTMTYNHMNLPSRTAKPNTSRVDNIYDANGAKWQQLRYDNNGRLQTRTYIDGMEFLGSTLELVNHAHGYIQNTGYPATDQLVLAGPARQNEAAGHISSSQTIDLHQNITYNATQEVVMTDGFHARAGADFWAQPAPVPTTPAFEWRYRITDHLGNTRALFADRNADGLIRQSSDATTNEVIAFYKYAPFGLEQGGSHSNGSGSNHRYRYNGKELDEATGLYDYGARWYDPAVARWGQVDPLADQYAPYSPYNYVLGNPIRLIDPDGRSVDATYKIAEDGKISKVDDQVHYDADGNEVDILIAGDRLKTNKDGSIKNPHIQVGKNYLKGARELTVNKGGDNELTGSVINFGGNEEEARNVFEFAAENTDVEWSLFTTENNGLIRSMVTTSFEEGQERLGASLAKENASGLLYHDHSHPRSDKIIDTSQLRPSEGDKDFARAVRTINPDARVRVYFNGAYHDY